MSYTVQLMRGGSPSFVFASPTPFLAPKYTHEFDDLEPPTLCMIHRVWTIQGRLKGAEAAVAAAWNALLDSLETVATYPTSAQLLQGAAIVQVISGDSFKIEAYEAAKSDLAWRGELRFTVKITATQKKNTPIAKLTQHESWSYDEAGLLTQRLVGEVVTPSGTSAIAQTDDLGLDLPGPTFGFVTAGPNGVDYEQVDRADTIARFTSTIRQVGLPLPSGVGPSFKVGRSTSTSDGWQTTTTTATARGNGAVAAVAAAAPQGAIAEATYSSDAFEREASARYVQRVPAAATTILRTYSFTFSGGGQPKLFTLKTGGRTPAEHTGAFRPVTVRERIVVQFTGVPTLGVFAYPAPVAGLFYDRSTFEPSTPERTFIGQAPQADRWQLTVNRTYRGTSMSDAVSKASAFALALGGPNDIDLDAESTLIPEGIA